MSTQATQYTVRGVPKEVDRALRRRAKERNVSINQVIIDELTAATIGRRQLADFSDLVGRLLPDDKLDEILGAQRQIHPDDWR